MQRVRFKGLWIPFTIILILLVIAFSVFWMKDGNGNGNGDNTADDDLQAVDYSEYPFSIVISKGYFSCLEIVPDSGEMPGGGRYLSTSVNDTFDNIAGLASNSYVECSSSFYQPDEFKGRATADVYVTGFISPDKEKVEDYKKKIMEERVEKDIHASIDSEYGWMWMSSSRVWDYEHNCNTADECEKVADGWTEPFNGWEKELFLNAKEMWEEIAGETLEEVSR